MHHILQERLHGKPNAASDFAALAKGAGDGSIPDSQLAAWLTAAYLRPLDLDETVALAKAMADSGARLDLSALRHPVVDKHSTGGVGDKTSLVLLPLLASLGLTVVKMSGRGLGVTGGTVDKLESIHGFDVSLGPERMVSQAREIGIAWTGQTAELAPADRRLYALRDETETVDSVPLIASSILSKKLAGGADLVSLDVKCGSGAFMKDLDGAKSLATMLCKVGERVGLRTHAVVTDMDQPLGMAVGNALEVAEAVATLAGASSRFADLCLALAGRTLALAGAAASAAEGEALCRQALANGVAAEKAEQWIAAQGGDARVVRAPWSVLPTAPHEMDVQWSGGPGFALRVDAGAIGAAAVELGAGRVIKQDVIDPSVGVEVFVAVGDVVQEGQSVFRIHAKSAAEAQRAAGACLGAIEVHTEPVAPTSVVLAEF